MRTKNTMKINTLRILFSLLIVLSVTGKLYAQGSDYPIKLQRIDRSQATYESPENTLEAQISALLAEDLEWYYETLTQESAALEKEIFKEAGVDPKKKFEVVDEGDQDFIIDKIKYKDGYTLVGKSIGKDGYVLIGPAVFIKEDGLWKQTFTYNTDEELDQYMIVTSTLEENTGGGDKTEIKEGEVNPLAQSFSHGSAGDPDYQVTRMVLYFSVKSGEVPATDDVIFRIGTGINDGDIVNSRANIKTSEIDDTSGGQTFGDYVIVFDPPVTLSSGITYYINLENHDPYGAPLCVETDPDAGYDKGTLLQAGADIGKDLKFHIYGNEGGEYTTPPERPTGLTAIAEDNEITLDWADNTDCDLAGYTVYRSTISGSDYNPIAEDVADSSYTDNAVTLDTTYYYVVTAMDTSANESNYSNEASAVPQAPSEPILEENSSGGDKTEFKEGDQKQLAQSFIHGSAGDPDYEVTGVVLYFSVKSGEVPEPEEVTFSIGTGTDSEILAGNSVNINTSAIGDSSGGQTCENYQIPFDTPVTLSSGVTYYLNLENEDPYGFPLYVETDPEAGYSKGALFQAGTDTGRDLKFHIYGIEGKPDTTTPEPPTGLTASAEDNQVTLDWTDNTDSDLESYTVYRSTKSGAAYSIIAEDVTDSVYTDASVSKGTPYYYVVTATDTSDNESDYSQEVSATPGAPYSSFVIIFPRLWNLSWYNWIKAHMIEREWIEHFAQRICVLCVIGNLEDNQGNPVCVQEIDPETILLNDSLSPQPWVIGGEEITALIPGSKQDRNLSNGKNFTEWYHTEKFLKEYEGSVMLFKFNKLKAMETLSEMSPGEAYDVTVSGELKDEKPFKGTTKIIITAWGHNHGWIWKHPGWLNSDKDMDNWWNKEKEVEAWWKELRQEHNR